jgi:hypothetical protein
MNTKTRPFKLQKAILLVVTSLAFAACTAKTSETVTTEAPKASTCSFNGQKIEPGASVNAYLSQTVPAGRECKQQNRTCTEGKLSGTYMFSACKVLPAPLTATINPDPAKQGDQITILPTGGLPPYRTSVASGEGKLTENIYHASEKENVVMIRVQDSAGTDYFLRINLIPKKHTHLKIYSFAGVDADTIKKGSNQIAYTFEVPDYETLKVRLWGPGGSTYSCNPPPVGGATTFGAPSFLSAGAGSVGKGGVATGGEKNIPGAAGTDTEGGAAPFGGRGGVKNGRAMPPGGGGIGGGSGAYAERTYRKGELKVGSKIELKIGAENGGACWNDKPSDLGQYAADGELTISW